jgi:hypothetical protein
LVPLSDLIIDGKLKIRLVYSPPKIEIVVLYLLMRPMNNPLYRGRPGASIGSPLIFPITRNPVIALSPPIPPSSPFGN